MRAAPARFSGVLLLCVLTTAAARAAQSTAAPAVATAYFYWYRWPGEHFNEPGAPGLEGHCHHFMEPREVSYLDPDWHEAQLTAMAGCGIDAALPVYWGAPGAYERPGASFSRAGLAPMVEALDRLAAAGKPAPGLGLFYDTSTLANDVRGVLPRGGRPDLRAAAGKDLFCRTVVESFERIPASHWARVDGRALVEVEVEYRYPRVVLSRSEVMILSVLRSATRPCQ